MPSISATLTTSGYRLQAGTDPFGCPNFIQARMFRVQPRLTKCGSLTNVIYDAKFLEPRQRPDGFKVQGLSPGRLVPLHDAWHDKAANVLLPEMGFYTGPDMNRRRPDYNLPYCLLSDKSSGHSRT